MSTNITAIRLTECNLRIQAVGFEQMGHWHIERPRPQTAAVRLVYGLVETATLLAVEANIGGEEVFEVGDIMWWGVGSGYSLDALLDLFRIYSAGTLSVTIVWENGELENLTVKDGTVVRYPVY